MRREVLQRDPEVLGLGDLALGLHLDHALLGQPEQLRAVGVLDRAGAVVPGPPQHGEVDGMHRLGDVLDGPGDAGHAIPPPGDHHEPRDQHREPDGQGPPQGVQDPQPGPHRVRVIGQPAFLRQHLGGRMHHARGHVRTVARRGRTLQRNDVPGEQDAALDERVRPEVADVQHDRSWIRDRHVPLERAVGPRSDVTQAKGSGRDRPDLWGSGLRIGAFGDRARCRRTDRGTRLRPPREVDRDPRVRGRHREPVRDELPVEVGTVRVQRDRA